MNGSLVKHTIGWLACGHLLLATATAKPPNIILILADDMGFECVSAYGCADYRTPVIDGLGAGGIVFDSCHSQPLCTPSRVQIMTGQYNVRNYTRFGTLDRSQRTFAHLLKERGYATAIAGKWQLGPEPDSPQHFGFDESCLWQHTRKRTTDGSNKAPDTRYANPVIDYNGKTRDYRDGEFGPDIFTGFLCDFIRRNRDKPFLAYYPMALVHCPFSATPGSEDWDPEFPGSTLYRGEPRYFPDMVAYVDRVVGRIVAVLEEEGLRERTLIIFTGDNGTDKPIVTRMKDGREVVGSKGETIEYGTRVPLIVNWPGTIAPGQRIGDLVDFSDFLPTMAAVAGAELPPGIPCDGRVFLPQFRPQDQSPRKWVYCWYSPAGKQNKLRQFVRNHRYKLYADGRFFDIAADVYEQQPLSDPDAGQSLARETLRPILEPFLRLNAGRPQDAR